MPKGKVKQFDNQKGYGLIITDEGKEISVDSFVLNEQGYKTLSEGDIVVFEIVKGIKGDYATNVTKVEAGKEAPRGANPSKGKEDKRERIEPQVW